MGNPAHREKQSKEETSKKACIREHKRLMKMNVCYDDLRKLLQISPHTSKLTTLVQTVMYINFLQLALKTDDKEKRHDASGEDSAEKPNDVPTMGCKLEMACTLQTDIRAILPPEEQDLSCAALLKKYPWINKLLGSRNILQQPAHKPEENRNVQDNCSIPSFNQGDSTKEERDARTVTDVKVKEQTATNRTQVPSTPNIWSMSENSNQCLINILQSAPWCESNNHELECLQMSAHEQDLTHVLPTFSSLVSSIQAHREEEPSTSKEAPLGQEIHERELSDWASDHAMLPYDWNIDDLQDIIMEDLLGFTTH